MRVRELAAREKVPFSPLTPFRLVANCILSMTVVPFPGFSVMHICISMLQSFRFGPWEPGNEVKYTARLARTIDVINACESKIVSTCVCLMQNA